MIVFVLSLTSCGVHSGLTYNTNNTNTEVVLSKKNFKVVQTIKGQATDTKVFGFGGLKKSVLAEARKNMLEQANLQGTARAVINERVEIHRSYLFIMQTYAITVTAEVVEFTE